MGPLVGLVLAGSLGEQVGLLSGLEAHVRGLTQGARSPWQLGLVVKRG